MRGFFIFVPVVHWGDERTLEAEDVSALFVDDVRHVKRTTNSPDKLVERQGFPRTMNMLQQVGHRFSLQIC